jgi:(S)-ureidoglycine aminohydrolase
MAASPPNPQAVSSGPKETDMNDLGFTRSANCADHLLQTPDSFIRGPMPQISGGLGIVHVAPARGARFLQYTAELDEGGILQPIAAQRFVYILEGKIEVGRATLTRDEYAYCPAGVEMALRAHGAARVAVIEKAYQALPGVAAPDFFTASEINVPSTALGGDPRMQVRCLLPSSMAFDFAVNTMVYAPGAALPLVEIHVMEHGLLMLEGGGIYRLGERWYPVTAGDFIWMAPYCPQWFGAIGEHPAKYLLYKDWNR